MTKKHKIIAQSPDINCCVCANIIVKLMNQVSNTFSSTSNYIIVYYIIELSCILAHVQATFTVGQLHTHTHTHTLPLIFCTCRHHREQKLLLEGFPHGHPRQMVEAAQSWPSNRSPSSSRLDSIYSRFWLDSFDGVDPSSHTDMLLVLL